MRYLAGTVALLFFTYLGWQYHRAPVLNLLSLRIGQTFEQVVADSSYPVEASSNIPSDDQHGFGVTWVSQPAVIIKFNDPQYGFTMPPTTFAAVMYVDGKVSTIRTSASLKKLQFSEAITVLKALQNQFISGGWRLENDAVWFDLSLTGQAALQKSVRSMKNSYMIGASLVAPNKYSIYFTLRCAADCDSVMGLDRYLVDVSIGEDF